MIVCQCNETNKRMDSARTCVRLWFTKHLADYMRRAAASAARMWWVDGSSSLSLSLSLSLSMSGRTNAYSALCFPVDGVLLVA